MTLKERIAVLETKVESLTSKIDNHCRAHLLDRVIQAVLLLGMSFLIKVVLSR